jgi:hypothetical protein
VRGRRVGTAGRVLGRELGLELCGRTGEDAGRFALAERNAMFAFCPIVVSVQSKTREQATS